MPARKKETALHARALSRARSPTLTHAHTQESRSGASSKATSASAVAPDKLPPPVPISPPLPLRFCKTPSAVHVACERGDVSALRQLLMPTATGEVLDSGGGAGGKGDAEFCADGAGMHRLWEVTEDSCSVFHAVAAGGAIAVLKLVCAAVRGAEWEASAGGVAQGLQPQVERLLQQLLQIRNRSQGHTCLMTACARGHFDMAAELCVLGGIELLRAKDYAGKTCLDHVPQDRAHVAAGGSGGSGDSAGHGSKDRDGVRERVLRGCSLVARSLHALEEIENASWASSGAAGRREPQEHTSVELQEHATAQLAQRLKLAKKEARLQQLRLTGKNKALQALRDKCARLETERAALQELPLQREALLQEIEHLSSSLAHLEHREREKEAPFLRHPTDGGIAAGPDLGAGHQRGELEHSSPGARGEAEVAVGADAYGYAGACDTGLGSDGGEGNGDIQVGATGLAEAGAAVLCEGCRERESVTALTPCGHVCVCEMCAGGFGAGSAGVGPAGQARQCPICHAQVVGTLRIFLS